MPLITWNEKYSVNIAEIDNQHKILIGLLNQLDDAMAQGKGKLVLDKVLKELIQYTQTHFANEERILKTHGYPDFEEHSTKHEKMTQKVLDIYAQYQAGKVNLTIDVLNFLEKWVDMHIMETDKKYASFLNSKGVR